MNREYWQRELQEAEAELDAARTRTAVNEAASKFQYAKARLKALQGAAKKPSRANRGSRSAAACS